MTVNSFQTVIFIIHSKIMTSWDSVMWLVKAFVMSFSVFSWLSPVNTGTTQMALDGEDSTQLDLGLFGTQENSPPVDFLWPGLFADFF